MNLSPVLTPMTPQTEVAMRIANIGDSVCYLYHERFEQLEEQLMGITGESLTYERFREVISSFLGEQGGGLRWVRRWIWMGLRCIVVWMWNEIGKDVN